MQAPALALDDALAQTLEKEIGGGGGGLDDDFLFEL